jgi:hypothetical protein
LSSTVFHNPTGVFCACAVPAAISKRNAASANRRLAV